MPRRIHLAARHLAAVAFYGLLAFILLHPLIVYNGVRVAGFDFFDYNWNFWWIRHALTTPGLNLYATNFVMFPHVNDLGYHALTAFWYPLWAVLEPLVGTLTVINIIIFLVCVLNGYLLFVFLRSEGVSTGLALLGGAALQVSPILRYFYYNTHINLMDWFWPPVHLLLWKQIFANVEAGRLGKAATWGIVQGIGLWGLMHTDLQFPIFVAFLLVPYGVVTLWRSKKRLALMAVGLLTIGVGLALMWFAGPLQAIVHFKGELAPGSVEDRPGIPFPLGFLTMSQTWWEWSTPSLGAFVSIALLLSLLVSLLRARNPHPPAPSPSGGRGAKPLAASLRERGWGEGFHLSRWLWLLLAVPPFILALGPTLTIGGTAIPLPFRWMHALTNGNFRMPWRLAPIYLIATLTFIGQTWTPLLPKVFKSRAARSTVLAAVFLFLAVDVRLFETRPLEPAPTPYHFYQTIGQEQGSAYDNEVILEVPTAAGTGETLLGDPRAIQLQFYQMTHGKRLVNGFVSRTPVDNYWPLNTDDPLLAWLGQRRHLDPSLVEPELRRIIPNWPVGYVVIHTDLIEANSSTLQEIVGYFNSLDDLLCPYTVEGAAIVYRNRWHPDGCPPRTPPEIQPDVYQVDIGSPDDVRYIGWGWHWAESVSGLTLRWAGEYPQTKVYVDLPPGAYEVSLSAQAFWETRKLRLLVNDTPLDGTADVTTDSLHTYTFQIPASAIGDGKHVTLTLDYDSWIVPAEVGQSSDPRKLAISVDWIQFHRTGK